MSNAKKQDWAAQMGAPIVSIPEAINLISGNWGLSRPLCLVGPAGIGKTQAVKQAAERYKERHNVADEDFSFIYIMCSHVDREHLVGLIFFSEDGSDTFQIVHSKQIVDMVKKPHGVIFFDECNRPNDMSTLNAFFGWITERGSNGLFVPEQWAIVAAMNPGLGADYKVSPIETDAAFRRRLSWVYTEFNSVAALDYMRRNQGEFDKEGNLVKRGKFHTAVYKFLRDNRKEIMNESAMAIKKIAASPATWEDVSLQLFKYEDDAKAGHGIAPHELISLISTLTGTVTGMQFGQFYLQQGPQEEALSAIEIIKSYKKDPVLTRKVQNLIGIAGVQTEVDEGDEDDLGDPKGQLLNILPSMCDFLLKEQAAEIYSELDTPEEDRVFSQKISEESKAIAAITYEAVCEFMLALPQDLLSSFMQSFFDAMQGGDTKDEGTAMSRRIAKSRATALMSNFHKVPGFSAALRENRAIRSKRSRR